jgi:hypothetical protein
VFMSTGLRSGPLLQMQRCCISPAACGVRVRCLKFKLMGHIAKTNLSLCHLPMASNLMTRPAFMGEDWLDSGELGLLIRGFRHLRLSGRVRELVLSRPEIRKASRDGD